MKDKGKQVVNSVHDEINKSTGLASRRVLWPKHDFIKWQI